MVNEHVLFGQQFQFQKLNAEKISQIDTAVKKSCANAFH